MKWPVDRPQCWVSDTHVSFKARGLLLFYSNLCWNNLISLVYCFCLQFYLHVLQNGQFVNGRLKTHERRQTDEWYPIKIIRKQESNSRPLLVHHITTDEPFSPFNCNAVFSLSRRKIFVPKCITPNPDTGSTWLQQKLIRVDNISEWVFMGLILLNVQLTKRTS